MLERLRDSDKINTFFSFTIILDITTTYLKTCSNSSTVGLKYYL